MAGLLASSGFPAVSQASDQIFAVRFAKVALQKDETIARLVVTAAPTSVYRIDRLPYDWGVSASAPSSFEVTCTLNSSHDSSTVADLRELNDLICLRVPTGKRKRIELTAAIITTRGPTGSGRTITLRPEQIRLSQHPISHENLSRR